MAQGKDNIKKSIEDFEKEVTCGVCQEQYTEPRILPCGHYYCKKCILKMSLRVGTGEPFSCPECRVDVTLPDGNVDNLKTAFSVNRLKDMYSNLLQALQEDQTGAAAAAAEPEHKESTSPTSKCETHGDALVMFCVECKQPICRDCALSTHKQHTFGYNSLFGPMFKKLLVEAIQPLREVEESFCKASMKISALELELEAHGKSVTDYIESHFKDLHGALDKYKQTVLEESKLDVARRLANLNTQKMKLLEASTDIHKIVEDAEECSMNESNDETMGRVFDLENQVNKGFSKYQPFLILNVGRYNDYQLHPVEDKLGEMKIQTAAQFEDHIQNVAELIQIPISSNDFTVIKLKQEVPMKSTNSFEICSKQQNRTIDCYISQPHTSSTFNCDVCRTGSCMYLVTFTAPDVPGEYQLHVSVDGVDIHNSPFSLTVKDTRSFAKKLLKIA